MIRTRRSIALYQAEKIDGRYVLLNKKTNCAVTYGDDFGTMCVEARKYHAITGDPYRVYDSEAGRSVYWWPADPNNMD